GSNPVRPIGRWAGLRWAICGFCRGRSGAAGGRSGRSGVLTALSGGSRAAARECPAPSDRRATGGAFPSAGRPTMARHPDDTFTSDFERFFGRGLGVLLPSILTLWILWMAFSFVFTRVAEPINAAIREVVIRAAPQVVAPGKMPPYLVVTEEELEDFRQSPESRRFRRPGGQIDQQRARAFLLREQFRAEWDSHWYLPGAGLLVAILLIYLAGLLLGGLLGRRLYSKVE